MRPEASLPPDRLDDLRVRVAGDHGAVAEVEVDVLVAVDVPEAVAESVIDEDRVRRRVLPAGGHTAGDRALGDFPVLDRCPVLGLEPSFLFLDELVDAINVQLNGLPHGHAYHPPAG